MSNRIRQTSVNYLTGPQNLMQVMMTGNSRAKGDFVWHSVSGEGVFHAGDNLNHDIINLGLFAGSGLCLGKWFRKNNALSAIFRSFSIRKTSGWADYYQGPGQIDVGSFASAVQCADCLFETATAFPLHVPRNYMSALRLWVE